MRVLDLFSGIGGFSLGLRMAGGFETVQFCEIDPYCQKVLAKNFPGVPIHEDIKTFRAERGSADVICGGFPCQDISVAGKGAGITGERSGLWSEYARIIGDVQPRYVIVENSAALLARGLGRVLGDLAQIGYDTEWHCIPAAAIGAPHIRDRTWIIAYPDNRRFTGRGESWKALLSTLSWAESWHGEPELDRMDYGLPDRVDRLRGIGNAIVPQIAEIIGRAIMTSETV